MNQLMEYGNVFVVKNSRFYGRSVNFRDALIRCGMYPLALKVGSAFGELENRMTFREKVMLQCPDLIEIIMRRKQRETYLYAVRYS